VIPNAGGTVVGREVELAARGHGLLPQTTLRAYATDPADHKVWCDKQSCVAMPTTLGTVGTYNIWWQPARATRCQVSAAGPAPNRSPIEDDHRPTADNTLTPYTGDARNQGFSSPFAALPRARPPVPHECGPHDAKQQFTITMTPVDGKGPVGTITGSRSQSDGWLLAEVKGSGCTDGSVR
jgi:hypothetical protein